MAAATRMDGGGHQSARDPSKDPRKCGGTALAEGRTRMTKRLALLAIAVLTASACGAFDLDGDRRDSARSPTAPVDPKRADGSQPGGTIEIASKPLLRLTNRQYTNAVRDVFGMTNLVGLPPEAAEEHYIAQAGAQTPADVHIEAYSKLAAAIAQKVASDTAQRMSLVGCEPKASADDTCLVDFTKKLTTKLYRRPASDEESSSLVAFAATGAADGWAAVRNVIEVALQSPRFLYRVNVTVDGEERPGLRRLDGYSMATNLALLLTESIPDDELLARAKGDELALPEEVLAEAERLLDKAESKEGLAAFYRQWLAMDALLGRAKDTGSFPKFSAALIGSMEREVSLVAQDLAGSNRPFLDLLDADFTYVDDKLASFYGITAQGAAADTFVRAPIPEGRPGLTGRAGFLANISSATTSSPTQRGNFILKRVLCEDVGPAVMVVESKDPAPEVPKTTRQRMEELHAAGSCQGCHRAMDGIGFGLEGFDGLGDKRTTENGLPINDKGLLVVRKREVPFQGAVELAQALRHTEETNECLSRNVVRWAIGRALTPEELPGSQSLTTSIATGDKSLRSHVLALVQSDFFRLQRTP